MLFFFLKPQALTMPFLSKTRNQLSGGVAYLFYVIIFCLLLVSHSIHAQNDQSTETLPHSLQNHHDSIKIIQQIDRGIQLLKNNKPEGITQIENAIAEAKKRNKAILAAQYINERAVQERYFSHYDVALKLHQKCLPLAKEKADTLLLSRIYNNIGVCYRRIDSYQLAIENHQKALLLAEKMNDSVGMAMAINSIGNVELVLGNLDKSMNYFNRSLKLEQNRNNLIGVAINFNNIGHVYQEKGYLLKACIITSFR